MKWYWFMIFPVVLVNCYELKCGKNLGEERKNDSLPKALALNGNYKIVVRHTNWLTNVTSLITESRTANETHITITSGSTATTHFILGNHNYTFNETSCAALPDATALPAVYLQPQLAETYNFNGISMAELIELLFHYPFSQGLFHNETEVGGIDAVLWLGCGKKEDKIIQSEVAYAGEHSQASYSSTVKKPYILSLRLAVFNDTDKTLTGYESSEITQLEMLADVLQVKTELPEGLYCSGFPESKRPVMFPKKFEMSFDYTDVDVKVVHNIDVNYNVYSTCYLQLFKNLMFYNGNERIFWMRLNAQAGKDTPFVGNATIPEGITSIHVIHDFQYGLQYILDGENNICSSVSAIDENFGDVQTVNASTKEIDLKIPAQLFLSSSDSVFYYAGKRIVDDLPLDVYVTKVINSPTVSTVIEMLYTTENWIMETAVAPFLHSIIQYHKNESGKGLKTIIRLHSFKNESEAGIQQTSLSIYPCLKFVEDSYLYINIKNTTLKDLESFGIGLVREGLREAVAHVANVSVLRIANFFFKQIQENVVAFFVVGEASGIKPANTWNRSNETNAESAVNLLNATLREKDIRFPVFVGHRMVMLSLSKASLGTIPTTWGTLPIPEFRGYTGGSMFVLGFFMLLLGTALGIGIVYFIWKRQRFTGLAYQVFE
uniref:ZP domain-containing protein n=1 Tax=Elaeophora elaphi TaxID=1147741 RepID=A0A0R3RZS7_9BILA